jgi:hypothetical protein
MPRRETSEESRERHRRENARASSHARIHGALDGMHNAKDRLLNAGRGARRFEHRRRRVLGRHAEIARGGMRAAVRSLFVLLFLPAILVVDMLLAGGTIDFLVAQSPALLKFASVFMLKFCALAAILIVEIMIAISISDARDKNSRPLFVVLVAAAIVIAGAMAFMSFVLAGSSGYREQLSGPAAGLPWVAAAFTLVLHSLAMLHGDAVRDTPAFLSLWLQLGVVTIMQTVVRIRAERADRAIRGYYRRHTTAIDPHNVLYPESPARFGPVDAELAALLRTMYPPEELARWLGPKDVPPEPPVPSPPSPPQSSAPAPPPPTPKATVAPSARPAEHANVDEAYSTLVAEEEARAADSEIKVD